jgi:hypothetical protein
MDEEKKNVGGAKNDPQISPAKPLKSERWFAGYIVAGFVLWLAQSNGFDKNTYDTTIILVVGILCGVFYHRIKARIKGKEWLRIVGTFLIIELIAGGLIGFSTAIVNHFVDTTTGASLVSSAVDGNKLTQLTNSLNTTLTGIQTQWDQAQNSIDENADSNSGYLSNISGYQTLQNLTDQRYADFVPYSNQVEAILSKYSTELTDAFSQLSTATENAKSAEDAVFTAKVNYYQALVDQKSDADIQADISAVNSAVDQFNQAQQADTQAQTNWQTAYNKFFSS